MDSVETVTGPVAVGELGQTLMHEHLFVMNPELQANYPDPAWDEDRFVDAAVQRLDTLVANGFATFVDLTVMGIGRDITRIARVAERTRMNIVAATGFYTMDVLPIFFRTNGPGLLIDRPDPLIDMFVRDIREGIAGTGIKASIIKVVTDKPGITPDVRRVLEAAVVAHQDTGAPITTHTHAASRTGLLQQDFFRAAGVDLEHVLIGHCGDSTDIDYLRELMDNGSTIGLDRFGLEDLLDDDSRVSTAIELCELGYADKITLSHDAAVYSVNRSEQWRAENVPRWTTTTIPEQVLPRLREAGISDETLHTILVENPARILSGATRA